MASVCRAWAVRLGPIERLLLCSLVVLSLLMAVALEAEIGRFEVWVISADGAEPGRVADDATGGRSLWRPR